MYFLKLQTGKPRFIPICHPESDTAVPRLPPRRPLRQEGRQQLKQNFRIPGSIPVDFHVLPCYIMVNMNDDKYDIHGIYMADATWDNDLEHHYFNHALLTFYEVGLENVSFYENDLCIFDVQNSEEFLEKIDKHPSAIFTFIRIIKQIDKIYYEHLDKMYDLDGSNRKMLLDIYHYILLHTKNRVSSEKFMDAFKVLFPFIYKMDDKKINEYIIKIGEENKRRDSLFFKGGR